MMESLRWYRVSYAVPQARALFFYVFGVPGRPDLLAHLSGYDPIVDFSEEAWLVERRRYMTTQIWYQPIVDLSIRPSVVP